MAFTFHDHATNKSVFDIACSDMIARKEDGTIVKIVDNGVVAAPAAEAPTWASITGKPTTFAATPASVLAAHKAKAQIAALADSTATDVAGVVAALNLVIAALKA